MPIHDAGPADAPGAPRARAPLRSPIQALLEDLHARLAPLDAGAVATYIPELATADPARFGIAVATVDGAVYEAGDARHPFTLQSISKPLTYALALDRHGEAAVRRRVGVEPTGEAFNAIRLSPIDGTPLNPMVNAGAIAMTGLATLGTTDGDDRFRDVLGAYSAWAGHPLAVDEAVYRSESATGQRNRAIAHLLASTGCLDEDPEVVVERYFRQCSVLVTTRDLALIGATLAAGGRQPLTGARVASEATVRSVLSVMATCGMYDGAGGWLVDVGLPAKSGVSGGLLAVLPGRLAIAVFSPPLDERGNSVRGLAACRELSERFGLHLAEPRLAAASPIRVSYDLARRRSTRRRPEEELARLAVEGRRALVLELQGDLTFATAEGVLREAVAAGGDRDVLVLDLRRVARVDAPVWRLVGALASTMLERGAAVILSGVRATDGTAAAEGAPATALTADLDGALEWAEGMLLRVAGSRDAGDAAGGRAPAPIRSDQRRSVALGEHELVAGLRADQLRALAGVLETRAWQPGERVVRRGDPADELFLIVAGELAASVEVAPGVRRRLSTIPAGTVLGELAFLGTERRTADVHAATAVEAYVLGRAAFDALAQTDPELRSALLEALLRLVARVARRMTDEVALLAG